MSRTAQLRALWTALNKEHFEGSLRPVPIRITRSRRTYGYFYGPNHKGGSASIRISKVMADTEKLVRETMLHEMIHQELYELGHYLWEGHGAAFQDEHVRVFGEPYVSE